MEEIEKGVERGRKENGRKKECGDGGKVFCEMEGKEVLKMIGEGWEIMKGRMKGLMELEMWKIWWVKGMWEKVRKGMEKKKVVVGEELKDLNIRDFV